MAQLSFIVLMKKVCMTFLWPRISLKDYNHNIFAKTQALELVDLLWHRLKAIHGLKHLCCNKSLHADQGNILQCGNICSGEEYRQSITSRVPGTGCKHEK